VPQNSRPCFRQDHNPLRFFGNSSRACIVKIHFRRRAGRVLTAKQSILAVNRRIRAAKGI
jgi:hypothetical protein